MKKILQIYTRGMKNLFQPIVIDFANATIETGIKKVNNVNGVFGFNGAGKTAFIKSVDLYKKIVTVPNYLLQNETTKKLDKLLNFKLRGFEFSIIFEYKGSVVVKHSIKLEKSKFSKFYIITNEDISLSTGRTLNDRYKSFIYKSNQGIEIINDEDFTNGSLEYLKKSQHDDSSLVLEVVKNIVDEAEKDSKKLTKMDPLEKILFSLYTNVADIGVYLSDSDSHTHFSFDEEEINEILNSVELLRSKKELLVNTYTDETVIPISRYEQYLKENKKLHKFIQAFKPDLKEIQILKSEDGGFYHVRKLFKYPEYNVELEFESSGIKQLVRLFSILLKCAEGSAVFVDEIDTNINSVYFEKLVLFFKNYGKGQLFFTTHNVEAMNALKGQTRSILAMGDNNKIDVWVGRGNKSPIKDYVEGYFPNSPMNIEDFDFVNIFLGEEQDAGNSCFGN